MGPKKKGKKGKKGKKEEEPPPEEPSEYDTMDVPMLKEVIQMLRQQLEKAQVDRNYVQHERDTIESFYEITKQEIQDHENQIMAKDREMEIMEDNHRVEVRVYVQKVKHLDYEHKNNLKRVQASGTGHLDEERDLHEHRETVLRSTKQSLKLELKERDLSNEDEIEQMKQAHEKNLMKLREQFEKNNAALEGRCQQRLRELQESLELRRKVDIHEIEERKNLHINDLMKNHEKAFTQIKNYYNDITKDNLRLIDSLKNEIAAMKKKAAANTKLMHDVSQENKRLSEPLAAAIQEVEHLRHELKDEQKDKLSLRNAKARLLYLAQQVHDLKQRQADLTTKYRTMESDRNALYDTFEHTVQTIHKKGECKNLILEQRLAAMDDQHARKGAQLQEILLAANLDPVQARRVTETLDTLLDSKNTKIRKLQYSVTKESKAYNDTLRTFAEKLTQFGIPEEEIRALGFKPLTSNVNVNPAGLVAVE
ncbi:Growth arrest-specific protein 8 [Phytophthora fragariae]|uniref:Growth arrest-specific protein 8 n=1 Tax=Phytophthora fragariae TaxID=53985 RepID=A0A6G0QJB5_9STRA|nr:Growth arrest-specific protein 8 [Phytophthora fragariae]